MLLALSHIISLHMEPFQRPLRRASVPALEMSQCRWRQKMQMEAEKMGTPIYQILLLVSSYRQHHYFQPQKLLVASTVLTLTVRWRLLRLSLHHCLDLQHLVHNKIFDPFVLWICFWCLLNSKEISANTETAMLSIQNQNLLRHLVQN